MSLILYPHNGANLTVGLSCDMQDFTTTSYRPPFREAPNLLASEKKLCNPFCMKFILCRRCFTVRKSGSDIRKNLRKRTRQNFARYGHLTCCKEGLETIFLFCDTLWRRVICNLLLSHSQGQNNNTILH